jgi:hypothetical protein
MGGWCEAGQGIDRHSLPLGKKPHGGSAAVDEEKGPVSELDVSPAFRGEKLRWYPGCDSHCMPGSEVRRGGSATSGIFNGPAKV